MAITATIEVPGFREIPNKPIIPKSRIMGSRFGISDSAPAYGDHYLYGAD